MSDIVSNPDGSAMEEDRPLPNDAPSPRRKRRRSPRRFRRALKPGLAPGTLSIDPESHPPRIDVMVYSHDHCDEHKNVAPNDIPALQKAGTTIWVDVDGLGSAEILQQLGSMFGIHPLALEDIVNTHQRAKVDQYNDDLFVVARRVVGPPLATEQISFFATKNAVVTFQEGLEGDCFDPVRQRLREGRGKTRHLKSDYLLYEFLDSIIDGYFPVIERMGNMLDNVEDRIHDRPSANELRNIHTHRMELLQLRRAIWPLREAVQNLLRGQYDLISDETMPYLHDCYDHVVQIMDILDLYRDTCGDLRDYYYNIVSNRTNEIMRTLTIISTIFLPVTFIAGVYGMNFDVMPELKWRYGYPLCLLLMLIVAASFLIFFWRKGWLRSSDPDSESPLNAPAKSGPLDPPPVSKTPE